MDKQLRLLDSFPARGADGAAYKVMAYEHLRRVDLRSAGVEQWESTGLTEYRLASGERVDPNGRRRLAGRADRADVARGLRRGLASRRAARAGENGGYGFAPPAGGSLRVFLPVPRAAGRARRRKAAMSVFEKTSLACPACGSTVVVDLVHSVNAVRRPDLRTAILDRSFQRTVCPACGAGFRVEPKFTYLDTGRKQFIAAMPASELPDWQEAEARAQASFDKAFGKGSGAERAGRRACRRAASSAGWASTRS